MTGRNRVILYPPVYKKKMHLLQTTRSSGDPAGIDISREKKDSISSKRQRKDDDCGNDTVVTKKLPAARL